MFIAIKLSEVYSAFKMHFVLYFFVLCIYDEVYFNLQGNKICSALCFIYIVYIIFCFILFYQIIGEENRKNYNKCIYLSQINIRSTKINSKLKKE